jgi:hypothetical protein
MNIVLAQFWTNNITYSKYTRLINSKYCEEKNYIYHIESDDLKIKTSVENRSYTWYKPILLLEVLEKYSPDYVLFLDADAVVVDNNYNIEDFIEDNKDIVVTEDYGPSDMNAGVILIKNTEWVKIFLKKWYDIGDELEGGTPPQKGYYRSALWHDQTCFSHLLRTDKESKNKISVIKNTILNGRYYKDVTNKNFIFHAFSYGMYKNRTIDIAYYNIFNIPIPKGEELVDMANRYSTDKNSEHGYIQFVYNDLFKPIKETCKCFIEIGAHNGESIKLWRDYFTNSEIVGIDNNIQYSIENLKDTSKERITLLDLNQSKEEDLDRLSTIYNNVDVILDDGSHMMRDQQITFAKLFKILKSGGIYVLEDLHTSLELINKPNHWITWGDRDKTITLSMLKDFNLTGKIYSDYMTDDEMKYLNENIESIDIYEIGYDWSITSVIKKK